MSTGEETYGSTLQAIKSFIVDGIDIAATTTAISGKLNLADLTAVKAAQNGLKENEARFFVITDSQGKIPSKQKCYDVPSEVVRQMSLTTGNSIVDLALGSVSVDPIGVSVGDLIALTKVSVKLSDLAAAVGVTISLSGSMLINQYKILHTNGAREEGFVSDDGSTCTKGVYGLLSPWNKTLIEGSSKPTRWAWGTNLDELLQSGVLAFTSATISGVTGNWTIFVDCSATPDGGGYYHLTQTAIGRDDVVNLGSVYVRLGYYVKGGVPTFNPWRELTADSDNLILNADFSMKAPDSTPIGWTLTATTDKYIFGRGYVTIKDGCSIKQTVNLEVGKRYMLKLNVSSMNIGDYPCIYMTIKNVTDIYVDGTSKSSNSFSIDYNKQPVDEHTIVFTANGSTEITFMSDDDGWSSAPSISGISLVCVGEGTKVY